MYFEQKYLFFLQKKQQKLLINLIIPIIFSLQMMERVLAFLFLHN